MCTAWCASLLTGLEPGRCGGAATILVVGAVSGVLGVLYALVDADLKRLLAYSSVENIGIIMLGLGAAMLFQASQFARPGSAGVRGGALSHAQSRHVQESAVYGRGRSSARDSHA